MHIIALGWIYVVSLMAFTEKSVVAGIMTFTLYCAVPLGTVWFLVKRKTRHPVVPEKQQQDSGTTNQQHDSNKTS